MDDKYLKLALAKARRQELELQSEIIENLKEVQRRKLWRHFGYRSLTDFCVHFLNIDSERTEQIMEEVEPASPRASAE